MSGVSVGSREEAAARASSNVQCSAEADMSASALRLGELVDDFLAERLKVDLLEGAELARVLQGHVEKLEEPGWTREDAVRLGRIRKERVVFNDDDTASKHDGEYL